MSGVKPASMERISSARTTASSVFARKFIGVGRGASGGDTLRIMSYNLLADVHVGAYLYPRHRLKDITYQRRLPLLGKEIEEYQPDVLCVQELQKDDLASFSSLPCLKGFKSLYGHKRRPPGALSHLEGVAIFVRSAKFELVKGHVENFTLKLGENYDQKDFFLAEMNKPCTAVIAVLQRRGEPAGKRFAVVSIHLPFNKKQGHVKLGILTLLLKTLARVKEEHGCRDVFVCGDFNTVPNSMLYRFVREGRVELNADLRDYSGQDQQERRLKKMSMAEALREGDRVFRSRQLPNHRWVSREFLLQLLQAQPVLNDQEMIVFRGELASLPVEDFGPRLEALSTEIGLASAYAEAKRLASQDDQGADFNTPFLSSTEYNNEAGNTFFGEELKACVDYIFYTKEGDMKLLGVLETPSLEMLLSLHTTLPCAPFGSDHISLVADFSF